LRGEKISGESAALQGLRRGREGMGRRTLRSRGLK
jgi:hypothetical protein